VSGAGSTRQRFSGRRRSRRGRPRLSSKLLCSARNGCLTMKPNMTDPDEEPDAAKWETEVAYLLVD
jgi:hypothetical protein